ncbi:ADP-ribosyltransferase [Streptomyces mirabilis]|uniref:ADP-ribosyltransferase n=1 Tax=Streptomyces mirabilis TaxID=68239 RepID=UPI002257C796|nr:ADP-ribosyltransferase [Streptomyces mirabilis]MCX4609392.1 phage minor head protein [Streptomyces mirabilis]
MDEDLDRLLEDAEETVAEEVSAVLTEVADEFAQQLADATELVAARFSVSRIARMFTDRMPRIVRRLLRVSEQAADHTAQATDSELPPEWDDLPGRYDDGRDLPPAMSDYVDVTEHLLRAVGDRLAEAAREELAAGVDAGEDIEQLRARLRERFTREGAQLGEAREERIARTEAGRAWNTATLGAARDATGSPAPIVKQWLTRHDDRVREDHAHVDGQIRLLDEQFSVGGVKMDAPHDPTAPASQVVNCRCILAVHPETRAAAFESQEASPAGFSEARHDGRTAAADGSHLMGGMIALLPTDEDAARLAVDGGEDADELHLTLYFLGDDGAAWTEEQRNELIGLVHEAAADLPGPFTARAFGVNHWNPDSETPSWVWAVGDDRDRPEDAPTLEQVRQAVTVALEDTHARPDIPVQHSPWSPHVCGAYSSDAGPLAQMVERVGGITFDRIRLAFAGDHTDIPLGPEQEEELMATDVQAAEMLAVRTWSTPDDTAIAFEDQETGDGRIFAKGALKWDRKPMPLQYAEEMLMGHQGAELAGAIKTVKRDGNRITATGPLYATRPAGADAIQLLDEGAPLGISVDLDDVDIEFVDKTLDPQDAEWLFASARLPHASVLPMEDGSMMLSASTRAEWTASDGAISRSRYDLQVITGPDGALTASVIRDTFAGTGVLTAAAGDADDPEKGLVVYEQKSGELLVRITRARLRGATLVAMPAFKDARIVLDPIDETAAAPVPTITAAGETRDRVVVYVITSPAAVGAREVSRALGLAMSTARGHLNGAAKDGRIVKLAPGLFCGPSSMPEGHDSGATASAGDRVVDEEFHGTPGRPSYRKYHPSGGKSRDGRMTQHAGGGWLGSSRFSAAQHEDAMLNYQGRAYRDMNALLRSDTQPQRASLAETRETISVLSDLIAIQDPLAEDRTVYRGTRQLRLGLKAGDVFHDRGFTSTSDDEGVASSMTGVGGSLFRISAPAGTQALDVTSLGAEASEAEMILPPGTQFRVTAANEPDDPLQTAVYDVEVMNGRMASSAPTGRGPALAAASSGQFEDRISDWDRDTLVVDRRASDEPGLGELEASAWTAMQAADPMPAAWFAEPTAEDLPPGSGGVHYEDGRVYGWVAQAGEPHAGYPGKKLTIESLGALDLTHFLRARFALDDGSFIKAGAMTMNVGHHRDGAECETASCQFDDTRTVGAIVTVGMNDGGLWFSGAAAPWLSEWDRAVFAACQPSYHLRQGNGGQWQLRAVLTVPVPGHSSPLLAALPAVAERSNLALAASAAGLLPAVDDPSGQDPDARPDDVRPASASSADTTADLPGQRPDTASGRHPDAAPAPMASVDVEALAAALAGGPLIDLIADAVTRRQDDRRAEIAAMAALVAQEPVVVQNGVI